MRLVTILLLALALAAAGCSNRHSVNVARVYDLGEGDYAADVRSGDTISMLRFRKADGVVVVFDVPPGEQARVEYSENWDRGYPIRHDVVVHARPDTVQTRGPKSQGGVMP